MAFLALCFGFAKRLAEMGYRSDRSTTRVVLRAYDEPRLQVLLIATAVAALVAYAACAVAGPNSWIVISVRFAITGLGRHSALVRMRELAEDATKDIFDDRLLVVAIVSWTLITLAVVGIG